MLAPTPFPCPHSDWGIIGVLVAGRRVLGHSARGGVGILSSHVDRASRLDVRPSLERDPNLDHGGELPFSSQITSQDLWTPRTAM